MSIKTVIIIPTYNEAAIIESTLLEVFQVTKDVKDHDIHVLVFDSASTDATPARVQALQTTYPRLHFRSEDKKTGLGSAYHQAMLIALDEMSADIVFEFDADLSHQPCYLLPMLERMTTADVVMGSRYIPGGSIPKDWGFHRKLFSIVGNWVARSVLTFKYKDFTSGFRATRGTMLKRALYPAFISNHYAYKLELLWRLHQMRARIIEYPIVFIDRTKGESKLPTNSMGDALHVIFKLRYHEMKRYLKMCMVGVSGATVQCLLYSGLSQVISPFHASQCAVTAAIVNNFFLNSYFTFKEKAQISKRQKIKAFSLFLMYSVLMIQLQSYWIDCGVSLFGRGLLKENLMLMMGMGMGSIFNYFIYSRWVFRRTTS
ncbi:MAG: glycosyltransferase family 2 protein [Legionellaceae bacterium]